MDVSHWGGVEPSLDRTVCVERRKEEQLCAGCWVHEGGSGCLDGTVQLEARKKEEEEEGSTD